MTLWVWVFDGLLVLLLLVLAWRALTISDMFQGVAMFIAFGALMGLIYVRLKAPDVALIEVAIGAGITGALFFDALGRMRRTRAVEAAIPAKIGDETRRLPPGKRLMAGAICLTLGGVIGTGVWAFPDASERLKPLVFDAIVHTGVQNPVTGVLLDFRGYDTMLEMGVLMLVLFSVWALRTGPGNTQNAPSFGGPVLQGLARILTPLMLVIGAYLTWVGVKAPGGAFQGGAVMGAACILLMLSGTHLPVRWRGWPLRLGLMLGGSIFLCVGIATLLLTGHLLGYPAGWTNASILLIEVGLTVSIALILASLFVGRPPSEDLP